MNDIEHEQLARRAAESVREEAKRVAAPALALAQLLEQERHQPSLGPSPVPLDTHSGVPHRSSLELVSTNTDRATRLAFRRRRTLTVAAAVAALVVVGVVGLASLGPRTPTSGRPVTTPAASSTAKTAVPTTKTSVPGNDRPDSSAPVNQAASPEFLSIGDQVTGALASENVPDGATISNPALTEPVDIDREGIFVLPLGDHDFGVPLDELGFSLPADFDDYFQESGIELIETDGELAVHLQVIDVRAPYDGFRLWVY